MFGIGMPELIVIMVILLLLFGASRLPEIGKALGRTISEFKKSIQGINSDKEDNKTEDKK